MHFFDFIVGYEEVDIRRQKPEPDGLLIGIKHLPNLNSGYIFYIGDHETDVRSATNANQVLAGNRSKIHFRTIGVSYGTEDTRSDWKIKPDYLVHDTSQITEIIQNFNL